MIFIPRNPTAGAAGLLRSARNDERKSCHCEEQSDEAIQRREEGFTLVELMVVIVILGLLATIVVINVMPAMDRAAATTARANIAQIEEGLKLYKLANGRYPTAEEGLAALTPGTVDRLPNDPWGRPYRYAMPGQSGKPFTVATWGADGREGGSGEDQDLSN